MEKKPREKITMIKKGHGWYAAFLVVCIVLLFSAKVFFDRELESKIKAKQIEKGRSHMEMFLKFPENKASQDLD